MDAERLPVLGVEIGCRVQGFKFRVSGLEFAAKWWQPWFGMWGFGFKGTGSGRGVAFWVLGFISALIRKLL